MFWVLRAAVQRSRWPRHPSRCSASRCRLRPGQDPVADDWGTVVPNGGCAQADAWVASLRGLGDTCRRPAVREPFAAHSRPRRRLRNGGKDLVNLTCPRFSACRSVSASAQRSTAGRWRTNCPPTRRSRTLCRLLRRLCGGGRGLDRPWPAVSEQPAARSTATLAGRPASGGAQRRRHRHPRQAGHPEQRCGARLYLVSRDRGSRRPAACGRSTSGFRIPADRAQPVLALATTNEQVTTDSNGRPTLDPSGHYFFDPTRPVAT